MIITSAAQALAVLDDHREAAKGREAAVRYLADHLTPTVITRLVQALQDDDVGVRWEAATVLAHQGEPTLLEVLNALTDPNRVGDPRLRESAYHILHINQAAMPVSIADLLDALKGQVADIASLVEADRVLRAWEKDRAVKARTAGKPGTTGAMQMGLLTPQYGPARLTGRLSRLRGH